MADRHESQRSRSAVHHDHIPARLPKDKDNDDFDKHLTSPSTSTSTSISPQSAKHRSPIAPSSSSPRRSTRSSARKATSQPATTGAAPEQISTLTPAASTVPPTADSPAPAKAAAGRKRRRASPARKVDKPAISEDQESTPPKRRSKRVKVSEPATDVPPTSSTRSSARSRKGKTTTDMSSPEDSTRLAARLDYSDRTPSASSSRKSSRSKGASLQGSTAADITSAAQRTKGAPSHAIQDSDVDTTMTGTEDVEESESAPEPQNLAATSRHEDDSDNDNDNDDDEDEDEDSQHHYDEEDDEDEDDDPFGGFGGPGGPGAGLTSTLRALTGMMSGISSRLRDILNNLRQKGDSSLQLIALQELSEILLVSNEDNLSGHFSPDSFVKELVALMQPNEFTGEENPEIMLLACRSLANLMEAIPASTANVVYGGAVPVLCQKLLEIQFIDLAEQALSTLEKISVEYPTSIVREGGLTACLSYLDFFATSTQRTAVTTAANCCRNIPEDSFGVIRDVMPILLNVLGSSDQRVVEQASLCVTRIIESFKYQSSKLEELVSVDLLRAILRLLVPGTTNLISANIHTQFLRVLAITARSSPRLSAELFKLNVVETLYQILTGVSPPSETDDVASKLDSVIIMQALIHRPREQIIETLNVICELLPGIKMRDMDNSQSSAAEADSDTHHPNGEQRKQTSGEKRLELLGGCKDEVRRFALILFPTLTDAFSSTVNLSVRQKVLLAQLKMLSNLDKDILVDALKSVPYASFLASILSQQDHPSLVVSAIHSTELLLNRLGDIYQYQVYREGVIAEVSKLAAQQHAPGAEHDNDVLVEQDADEVMQLEDDITKPSADRAEGAANQEERAQEAVADDDHDDEDDGADEDDDKIEDDQENGRHDDEGSGSPMSSDGSTMSLDGPSHIFSADTPGTKTRIANVAKMFLQVHETEQQGKAMREKAQKILENLQDLASRIRSFYLQPTGDCSVAKGGIALFEQLSLQFDAEMLESVTSAELLASGLVRVLEDIFSNPDEALADSARAAFLEVFMGRSVRVKTKTSTAESPTTPFSVLVHKLQDLLSRSEHFEVLTVHQNTFDGNRSSAASMLAKQIRLRLVADEESEIPRSYRNIMVSIHAIATFKALDDYLRPRISLFERPRVARPRDGLSRALAAMASSAGLPATGRLAERLAAAEAAGSLSALTGAPPGGSSFTDRYTKHKKSQPETSSSGLMDATRDKTALRRSSRHNPPGPSQTSLPSALPSGDDSDDLRSALECADEKQLSDGDEGDDADLADTAALDAIVGELDEDLNDDPVADPSAVSVEVAAGGKVTAMNEDGTRVPTPAQATATKPPPHRSGSAGASGTTREKAVSGQQTPTPSTSSRPQSYAAAIQSVPQDWHIEFSLDNKVIPNETTIYRAVHKSAVASDDQASRGAWSAVHSIKFRRMPGPPPAETIGFGHVNESSADIDGVPASLAHHPTTASILRLLNILHSLNANLDDVMVENKAALRLNMEPLAQFVNTKLTAKLNRQLEEPLIVASNCLPSWSEDLARLYPFLFPFETRHLFLQSTSFGYARSMSRWQNAQQEDTSRRDRRDDRPFLGRLQRQKVRISRGKILESALKVMELYGASQSILEVEYFEEVGTGLGPTLEFYSTVSREFSKKKLKLFRDTDTSDAEEYAGGPNGLFPRPLSEENQVITHLFKTLGKFVARSMIDSRIIDINFNPIFFRIGDETNGIKPSLGAIKAIDPGLASSLKLVKKFALAKKAIDEDPNRTAAQKVADTEKVSVDNVTLEDLALDFTLPGYPEIELIPGGSSQSVTIYNVDTYLDKVIDMTLGSGVKTQVDAFRTGFSQVFPYSALNAFTPDELGSLFGRVEEDWTLETLMDSIKADHGFNMDSKTVKNLLQTMSELNPAQRRDFLQFTTGSPKLPIGGFRSLTPMFTVVCKPSEPPYTSDDYLPSVMTCVNYLKLPDYSSIEIMKKQLFTATREGQGAFHLS